ncbi:MAG: hypothetical protein ACYSVY_27945 [Planctomycetota bacterium]|jgi:hypothetical protein
MNAAQITAELALPLQATISSTVDGLVANLGGARILVRLPDQSHQENAYLDLALHVLEERERIWGPAE